MGIRPISKLVLTCTVLLGLAGDAGAGDFYLTGNLAISTGTGDSGGSTDFFANTGSDIGLCPRLRRRGRLWVQADRSHSQELGDSAAGLGGALRVRGDDRPRIRPAHQRRRDDSYFSEVTAWTFMPNLWIDVPLHQPIAWMFGRIPVLEPLTLYGGAGLGLSTHRADDDRQRLRGAQQQFLFGWQAGDRARLRAHAAGDPDGGLPLHRSGSAEGHAADSSVGRIPSGSSRWIWPRTSSTSACA